MKPTQLRRRTVILTTDLEIIERDDQMTYFIGWPGYRNAMNRSGLGYVETQSEWAHMQGRMLKWLATGKFRTRNPFFLIGFTVYALFAVSPVVILFVGPVGRQAFMSNMGYFGPHVLVGILLLINVVLSLLRCTEEESITGD
jgi:hypothetical protein